MTKTVSAKLIAKVIGFVDLGKFFPASVLKERIGLDVRVEQGSFAVGKKVLLVCSGSEEEVEILGIEMIGKLADPNLVRIHCSRPKQMTLPANGTAGWIITE